MKKIQRILFALMLLDAYPVIADTAARDPEVMYLTGLMFDRGESVPRDHEEAFRRYALAAEAGQPDAMNGLGLMYALGRGVPQDLSEAMKWWIKAVDGGSVDALRNIATAYYTGLGVRQSYSDAAKWFHLAADKGDADAMNALGLMYAQGSGVTRNLLKAIKLLKQSAYLGCGSAMINLGTLYAVGKGVKHDDRLAYAWLGAALLSGVSAQERDTAVYLLGMAAARLDPSQRARAEGLARELAVSIASGQTRAPDRDSAQALPGSTM